MKENVRHRLLDCVVVVSHLFLGYFDSLKNINHKRFTDFFTSEWFLLKIYMTTHEKLNHFNCEKHIPLAFFPTLNQCFQ